MVQPTVTQIVEEYGQDPFLILISCLLSLRTKDAVSLSASKKLFQYARDPYTLSRIPISKIEKLIYPVGFYRRKALLLHAISKDLITRFQGKVPHTRTDLLSLKGVGLKTANLVLGEGFGVPSICVDTHVHRISNRLGLVKTKTPDQTEKALARLVPKKYWIELNRLLVMWGQNVCVPISPFCSMCVLSSLCPKIGVKRHR